MPSRSFSPISSRRAQGALAVALLSSACQVFDPTVQKYEALLEHQKMVVAPYSSEHASRHGPGFGVTMKSEEAKALNAPNSADFMAALESQLIVERSRGNDYCPSGYAPVKLINSKHWYTEIWVDCNREQQ